jgi:sodium-dependent dicarboxylate transporter 2/3/5
LSLPGQKALALMIVASIAWMFEVVPLGVSSALFIMLVGPLGIMTTKDSMANFAIPTVFFILSSYIVAIAFIQTGLAHRASLYMSSLFGNKPARVLLGFMVSTALLATMLADVPTSLIFAGVALPLLKKNLCAPGSNFGKALMMGIPIAAASGGISTPAGSGLNILAMNLLKNTANVDLTFVTWGIIGLPTAAVLTISAWYIILKMVPPEQETIQTLDSSELGKLGPLSIQEKKFACIFLASRLLWFTDAWHKLDPTVVAIGAATACFLPGINLITWKQTKDRIGWDVLFLVGASNVLAMAILKQGSATWLTNTFLSGLVGADLLVLLLAVIAFGIYSHFILPVANATLAVAIPVIAVLASQAGINPALLAVPIGFCASCVFVLPLDPIPLTTYEHGYWKITDMMKPGLVISIVWLVLLTVVMYGVQSLKIL